jgi:hypothetical protein
MSAIAIEGVAMIGPPNETEKRERERKTESWRVADRVRVK